MHLNHPQINNFIKQILQYVAGVAWTWKTQIIKTIQDLFTKTKNERKLRIVAYITNATLLIGGTTIHSLLGFSIDKHAIVSKSNSIINIWTTIDLMIIDEISVVGCNMLAIMHLKLQKLKYNILPFDGMNIMFMGEFLKNFQPSLIHHFIQQTSKQPSHLQKKPQKKS